MYHAASVDTPLCAGVEDHQNQTQFQLSQSQSSCKSSSSKVELSGSWEEKRGQTTEKLNRHFLTASLHDFYELQLPLRSQLSFVSCLTHAQWSYLTSAENREGKSLVGSFKFHTGGVRQIKMFNVHASRGPPIRLNFTLPCRETQMQWKQEFTDPPPD